MGTNKNFALKIESCAFLLNKQWKNNASNAEGFNNSIIVLYQVLLQSKSKRINVFARCTSL